MLLTRCRCALGLAVLLTILASACDTETTKTIKVETVDAGNSDTK